MLYRRFIALALICLCVLAPSLPTGQAKLMMEKNISIFVDGEQLLFPDQQPFIDQHHRTLVPVRFFAQALGASVEWQALQEQVFISTSDKTLSLKVGEAEVLIHPDRIERMDSVAVLVNNRLLVPLRHISNYLDCEVSWDESSRIAHVFTRGQSKEEIKELMEKARHALLELPRVNSQENLQELLNQSHKKNEGLRASAGSSVAQEQMLDKSATTDALEAASDYSGTNVQVEGVDEGDIIKSDGEYLYVVKNQEILLVKAYPAEEMSVAGRISLAQNTQEIFVEQDRLLVISRDRPYHYRSSAVAEVEALRMPPYFKNNIIIETYDIKDKKNPVKLDSFQMEGNYIASRKIGNQVYVISSQYLNVPCKPVYYINQTQIEKPYSEIRYFPDLLHDTYLHIAQIDLAAKHGFTLETFLSSGNQIYCSGQNLYVTGLEYGPMYMDQSYQELQTQTRIYKFRLQDGIKYQAKGQVPGTVLNQFALDEYQDHLRIATTTQEWSSTHSQNSVYILNPELKVLSSITGIAPGERIYSTRFLQDRLYMVTFRQVDPFFVIDLNPQNPKVLGQLKIPGFSNYLHPYGDHYVIGLGYDTSLNKSGGVIQGGIKLSLYDVEDVSQPREVDSSISGDSGSYSEACENHRAFLLHHDLLAFPAQIYTERSPGNSYSSFEFQGAYIYTVSEQGFDYQGRITHLSPEDYLKAGDYWYDMNKTVRRIVVIDNNIYSISQGGIKANDKSTLKEIKHISI